MLLAVDSHEDFIDVEGIAVTAVLAFQSSRIYRTEFDSATENIGLVGRRRGDGDGYRPTDGCLPDTSHEIVH
jgi:hypothetical protein